MNPTHVDNLATATNLTALVAAGRKDDTHTVLTAMDDAERTGVFLATLTLAASLAKHLHISRGWDPEETPDLLHTTALHFLANKEARDGQD